MFTTRELCKQTHNVVTNGRSDMNTKPLPGKDRPGASDCVPTCIAALEMEVTMVDLARSHSSQSPLSGVLSSAWPGSHLLVLRGEDRVSPRVVADCVESTTDCQSHA